VGFAQIRLRFAQIRLRFDLDTDAPQDKLEQLLRLTERYCVVISNHPQRPAGRHSAAQGVTGTFSLRTGKITGSLQKFAAGAGPKRSKERCRCRV
jgi:hypothetical protein